MRVPCEYCASAVRVLCEQPPSLPLTLGSHVRMHLLAVCMTNRELRLTCQVPRVATTAGKDNAFCSLQE